jgi:ribosomal-protein-alanine acetyltransferase
VFRLLRKDPEAVVVSFLTGEESLALSMAGEIRRLVPDRKHYVVSFSRCEIQGVQAVIVAGDSRWQIYRQLRRSFRTVRIVQAAVLFTSEGTYSPLRQAAFLLAPRKVLAYNARLERHHLRLRTLIASWLFLRGVPLDRIFLRPRWLCPWTKDRTIIPSSFQILEGRPLSSARRRVAVLSPYFPYPLSHGGAVRIFHLLREASREFDLFLFAFAEDGQAAESEPVLEFCARVILVAKPRYREPRWSSLAPPEVCEYRSPLMRQLLGKLRREDAIEILQVEYTQLASYGGDILVEHDVTFDLHRQEFERRRSLSAWWDFARWRRFERKVLRRYRRVVAMSEKDAALLAVPRARVIANGVDLGRFQPEDERPGQRLLFIGSFRHFPNVIAYRFFVERVWLLLRQRFSEMTLTVVAGPDPLMYWRSSQDSPAPPAGEGIRLLGFVRDVYPLYVEANLVVVPTLVSAGTNLKVLEAMAMERAVVSTSSGCAGLGLEHGKSIWIADDPAGFVAGVGRLITHAVLRRRMARAGRRLAEQHFDWRRLGEQQRALWAELVSPQVVVRAACREDLGQIARIQTAAPEAAAWDPRSYLDYECLVAETGGQVVGFLVCRKVSEREIEIVNLAVAPESRRRGIATALLRQTLAGRWRTFFLEVRQSNFGARQLYKTFGFKEVGLRPNYYHTPQEDGIVMRLHS